MVGGGEVLGAAEISRQTGEGGDMDVECADYAIVEKLVCECVGEWRRGVCLGGGLSGVSVSLLGSHRSGRTGPGNVSLL